MAHSNRLFLPGNRYLIFFLSFLASFAPISTDMYLPGLPIMAQQLNTSNDMASYTMSMFFLVYAFSMLAWGPLSDKYGRKPVLIAGSLLYMAASILIAQALSITQVIFWRCAQALGSGAASAISLAIVKDILKGDSLKKMISLMQMIIVLAPLTAPVIGGGLLLIMGWRGIFWCLAACGLISLAGSLCLKETAKGNGGLGIWATFCRIPHVMKNRHFLYPLILFSCMSMPFMAFLGLSTFIYQDTFRVSPQAYSLFFAFNAATILLGPASYMAIFHKFSNGPLILLQLCLMAAAGLAIIIFGSLGPWTFALLFIPISYCGSLIRPPSTVIMLESIQGDNGVVTSLINFGGLFTGSISIFISPLPIWPNPVFAIGFISLLVSAACAFGWRRIMNRYK